MIIVVVVGLCFVLCWKFIDCAFKMIFLMFFWLMMNDV